MVKAGVFILILVVLVLVMGALFFFGAFKGRGSQQQESARVVLTEDSADEAGQQEEQQEEPPSSASQVREFDMVAEKWKFTPSAITVSQGDAVILNIESIDVAHGFSLPDFGIDEYLSPGEKIRVEFTADKKGTFKFSCSVYCGAGHIHMDGTLIVE